MAESKLRDLSMDFAVEALKLNAQAHFSLFLSLRCTFWALLDNKERTFVYQDKVRFFNEVARTCGASAWGIMKE